MAMEQPENLIEMYLLASTNQWLTTGAKMHPSGFATTFTTTCDKNDMRQQKEKKKNPRKMKMSKLRERKRISVMWTFACGEAGHYVNKCPTRKKASDEESEEYFHYLEHLLRICEIAYKS